MASTARRDLYDGSDPIFPTARAEERQLLIDLLQPQSHHVILDVPAWTGYLADGLLKHLTSPTQLICVEPSPRFAAGINPAFMAHCCSLTQLPLADDSIDRVGSMVGLHHLPRPHQLAFLREALRVLRPGGCLVFSEVEINTQVATFLNGPVHQTTMTGHRGEFHTAAGWALLLIEAGFVNVMVRPYDLHWNFPTTEAMAKFCHGLFGMGKVNPGQVLALLAEHFSLVLDDTGAHLPWQLVYGTGAKA